MQLNSYLMFDGNCEAAFKFYEQCLGGKITMMMTHKEAPSAENVSPEWQDKIMHACLDLGADEASPSGKRLLMGSDCPPGYFEAPQGFYVQISVPEKFFIEYVELCFFCKSVEWELLKSTPLKNSII